MAAFERGELEEMVERGLQVNREAEAAGDWRPMAEMYTEDATYGWNYGPDTDFMAVGRNEIVAGTVSPSYILPIQGLQRLEKIMDEYTMLEHDITAARWLAESE